jgi:hypothetical protein
MPTLQIIMEQAATVMLDEILRVSAATKPLRAQELVPA